MKNTANVTPKLLMLCISLLLSSQSFAVAYCALRDPVNTIYELFPEANSYRSSVKTVGREARQAVLDQLPFSIHFNELGRHTLYIALRDGVPLGFVHARSESGEWGISEFAWAMSVEMKITAIKIQRSRDPQARKMGRDELDGLVKGKGLAGLKEDFNADQNLGGLHKLLLKSALKTLVITEQVWSDEVRSAKALDIATSRLPDATRVEEVRDLYNPATLAELKRLEMEKPLAFDRHNLVGFRVFAGDVPIGFVVSSPFKLSTPARALWWTFKPDGEIVQVKSGMPLVDDHDFDVVLGYSPQSVRDCSSAVELVALELATLVRMRILS